MNKNRYPGIKPFNTDEKLLFFGRDKDIQDLYSIIFIKQIIVLYGKSGQGKSSLINAGLIPKLDEEKGWTYFNIRLLTFSKKEESESLSPTQIVSARLSQSLDNEFKEKSELDTIIPNENSFWYWIKKHQSLDAGNKKQYIIFFDQFEELFSYTKDQIDEFSIQLSDLLYNTIPVKFRRRISELDENNEISEKLHNILYEKPEIKVVFSIRSDRMSLLNILSDKHPSILQNCYELNALKTDQADRVICVPALIVNPNFFITPPFTYAISAVDKIIQHVTSEKDKKINLAILQIICRYVEEVLVKKQNIYHITPEHLGEIKNIFIQFYHKILTELNEVDRNKIQHLIEDELIDGGRRNPLSMLYIMNKFNIDEKLLYQLESTSLLRKEMDTEGRILIELSHDSLIDPILLTREKRKQEEEIQLSLIEFARKTKIENEVNTLRKARELDKLDKKAFEYIETETLRKQQRFYFSQVKLQNVKDTVKNGWLIIVLFLFFILSFIWSGVATFKLSNRAKEKQEYKNQFEKVSYEYKNYLNSYDSIKYSDDYLRLKKIYNDLEMIKNLK